RRLISRGRFGAFPTSLVERSSRGTALRCSDPSHRALRVPELDRRRQRADAGEPGGVAAVVEAALAAGVDHRQGVFALPGRWSKAGEVAHLAEPLLRGRQEVLKAHLQVAVAPRAVAEAFAHVGIPE